MQEKSNAIRFSSSRFGIGMLLAISFSTQSFAENSEINKTTSRYLRTKYMCRVASEDYQKPLPIGLDHFRMSQSHYGIADLYGDGSLDMFFGFSDDTFPKTRISEGDRRFYEGNENRSARNHQYSFYSTDAKFIPPDGTKYLVGRSFAVQDYNGDGVDDYVVAHWGTDYPPHSRRSNEILLSTNSGYKAGILPAGPGYNHSVASGDIDEDGDVDVVVGQPTTPGRLLFYVNDGSGSFDITAQVGISLESRTYGGGAVSLWDVDGDSYLDLIVSTIDDGGNEFNVAAIYWGEAGLGFESAPSQLSIPVTEVRKFEPVMRNGETMVTHPAALDFEFSVFGSDNATGVAAILESGFYSAWSLTVFSLKGRDPAVSYIDHSPEGQRFYIPWISACDLKADNDIDIVYDHFGQNFPHGIVKPNPESDFHRLDKIIWENELGKFSRRMLEGVAYFDDKFQPLIEAYAASVGVSAKPYVPAQVYFENNLSNDVRFMHPGYEMHYLPEYRFPYEVNPRVAAEFADVLSEYGPKKSVATTPDLSNVSPRVKEILERRKKDLAKN